MRSVADTLRQMSRESALKLTPAERVDQAFRLGDEDLKTFADAKGITLDDARAQVIRLRSAGRRPSACADTLGR